MQKVVLLSPNYSFVLLTLMLLSIQKKGACRSWSIVRNRKSRSHHRPEGFEQVQAELARRKNEKGRYSGVGVFSSRIKCGECGSWYGSKTWHSSDKYRKTVYRCNRKYDKTKGKACETPHLTEEEIKTAFLAATNEYLSGSSQRLADAEFIREYAGNTAALEARCDALTAEMNAIIEQTQNLIGENASVAMDQKVYAERYSRLVADYDSKKAEFDSLQIEIAGKKAREVQIKHFIEAIRELGETVTEFENGLFGELVDFMTVYKNKTIKVTFKDGTEI